MSKFVSRTLSGIYLTVGTFRNKFYDFGIAQSRRLPGSVISVGNIAVGGTGKSPVILALLSHLLDVGANPAVLTRGYGSDLKSGDWIVLRAGKPSGGNFQSRQLPDEASMQSVEFPDVPVIAGPSRFEAAMSFLKGMAAADAPTHWLLDDGFQHRAISRNFDIVLLDKANPFGNGNVLPYGMLREPATSLVRADHILFTGYGSPSDEDLRRLQRVAPKIPVSSAEHFSVALNKDVSKKHYFSDFSGKPLLLVAGIARPERLLHDLEIGQVRVSREWILPDHAQVEISALRKMAKGMAAIVTTSKDYWRNPEVFQSVQIPVFIKKTQIVLPASLLTLISEVS